MSQGNSAPSGSASKRVSDGSWVVAFVSHRGHKVVEPLRLVGMINMEAIYCRDGLRGYLRAFRDLVRSARRRRRLGNWLILTDTGLNIGLMVIVVSKLFGAAYVYRARGNTVEECKARGDQLRAWFHRRVFVPSAAATVPVSYYLAGCIRTQTSDQVRLVPVPLPIAINDRQVPFEQRSALIVVVSNFHFQAKTQGLVDWVPVLDAVLEHCVNHRIEILGSGRFMDLVRAAIARSNHPDRIRMRGHVDPEWWLRNAKLLAHFSYLDAYPSVLAEARAFGTPVLCNDGVGMSEQVLHGNDGLAYASPATADVARIAEVLEVPQSWQSISERGRQRVCDENHERRVGVALRSVLEAVVR